MPFCSEHGIRVHWSFATFVYYNGDDALRRRVASLRNIRGWRGLLRHNIFNQPNRPSRIDLPLKNSEDALT